MASAKFLSLRMSPIFSRVRSMLSQSKTTLKMISQEILVFRCAPQPGFSLLVTSLHLSRSVFSRFSIIGQNK